MSGDVVAGMVGFAVFFTMWVVLPNVIHKKHHSVKEE